MYMYSCKYLNLQWKDLQLFARVEVNKGGYFTRLQSGVVCNSFFLYIQQDIKDKRKKGMNRWHEHVLLFLTN